MFVSFGPPSLLWGEPQLIGSHWLGSLPLGLADVHSSSLHPGSSSPHPPPHSQNCSPPPSPSSGGPQLMASGWLGISVFWTPYVLNLPPTLSTGHTNGQTHRVSILPAFGTPPSRLNNFLLSSLSFVYIVYILLY